MPEIEKTPCMWSSPNLHFFRVLLEKYGINREFRLIDAAKIYRNFPNVTSKYWYQNAENEIAKMRDFNYLVRVKRGIYKIPADYGLKYLGYELKEENKPFMKERLKESIEKSKGEI